jgi:hypothetical protein
LRSDWLFTSSTAAAIANSRGSNQQFPSAEAPLRSRAYRTCESFERWNHVFRKQEDTNSNEQEEAEEDEEEGQFLFLRWRGDANDDGAQSVNKVMDTTPDHVLLLRHETNDTQRMRTNGIPNRWQTIAFFLLLEDE